MANTRRTYSTDRVDTLSDPDAPKERLELLREFYKKPGFPKSSTTRDQPNPSSTDPIVSQSNNDKAELISFPVYKQLIYSPSEMMWAMQEWDGHVTAVEADKLIGLMAPVGIKQSDLERLEFPLALISDKDRDNIVVGSIFRLSAGYSRKATGQVRQQLSLYFRPRPKRLGQQQSVLEGKIKNLFKTAIQAPRSELFAQD